MQQSMTRCEKGPWTPSTDSPMNTRTKLKACWTSWIRDNASLALPAPTCAGLSCATGQASITNCPTIMNTVGRRLRQELIIDQMPLPHHLTPTLVEEYKR